MGLIQCAECGKPVSPRGNCPQCGEPGRQTFRARYDRNMRGMFYIVAAFAGLMVLAKAFGGP